MSEPNPYELPRELEPLTKGQIVKRSVGVVAIILLTPPAVVVAAAAGCTIRFISRTPFVVHISAAIPLVVLTGLMVWAASIDREDRKHANRSGRRAKILLATPPIVGLSMVVGFGLALQAGPVVGAALQAGSFPVIVTRAVFFWLTPAVALVAMLWLAWWAGD